MYTSIQPTSLNAFYTEIKPHLGDRQKVVLEEIKKGGNMTNSEIKEALGVEINTVTPRVNELVKLGLVMEGGKRTCRVTGRTVIAWEAVRETLF
jgi:predicted transcriptional regulator